MDKQMITEKYGIRPGTIFKLMESDSDKEGARVEKKYRVLELYPHIALAEQLGRRSRIRRSFSYWSILKAQGKIQDVPRKEPELD